MKGKDEHGQETKQYHFHFILATLCKRKQVHTILFLDIWLSSSNWKYAIALSYILAVDAYTKEDNCHEIFADPIQIPQWHNLSPWNQKCNFEASIT